MKRNQPSNSSSDIVSEACSWFAQLETGNLSAADLDAFREWIGRSPRHASEIRRLAMLSEQLNILSDLAEPLSDAAESYQPIVSKRGRFSTRLVGAALASVMIAVILVVTSNLMSIQKPVMFATPVGGYLIQELSDGSVVRLNTDSQIEVLFDRESRTIRLNRGEVFFDVAHDTERPFLVQAANREVKAVGTAFVVRLEQQKFEVLVTEGVVKVEEIAVVTKPVAAAKGGVEDLEPRIGLSNPVFLKASQAISILDEIETPVIKTVAESEINRQLTWHMGYLEFSDMSLEEVIQEVSRHTELQLEIVDPAIKSTKFDGVFPTGDVRIIFDALETAYGIQIEYTGSNAVLIGERPNT